MRPLNPAGGVVERFACELRALRAAAGEPAFWKMARHCDVSKSALAAAVAGYELPSERVTLAYVHVCGGDPREWSERLAQARGQLEAEHTNPATGQPPQHTVGTELALVRRAPLIRAMTYASPAPRTTPAPWRTGPTARPRQKANRRALALTLTAVTLALGAVAAVSLSPDNHRAPTAYADIQPSGSRAPGGGGGPFAYDVTTGPGCIMVFTRGQQEQRAQVEPENSVDMDHAWATSTSDEQHWAIPNCTNTILYSQPSTEKNRYQWQNDYVWKFFGVPSGVPCTFHIYIAASPLSKYNATYDWTNGTIVSAWVDDNAFTVDQADYAGSWYTDDTHTYTTGMAYLMLTDQRGDNPPSANAPLTASEVRLTCTP